MTHTKAVMLALVIALIAGCGGAPKRVSHETTQYKVVSVPESLYRCEAIPAPPSLPVSVTRELQERYDRQVAEYILDLYETGVTCKASLDSIRAWIEQAEAEVQKTNEEARRALEEKESGWWPF